MRNPSKKKKKCYGWFGSSFGVVRSRPRMRSAKRMFMMKWCALSVVSIRCVLPLFSILTSSWRWSSGRYFASVLGLILHSLITSRVVGGLPFSALSVSMQWSIQAALAGFIWSRRGCGFSLVALHRVSVFPCGCVIVSVALWLGWCCSACGLLASFLSGGTLCPLSVLLGWPRLCSGRLLWLSMLSRRR